MIVDVLKKGAHFFDFQLNDSLESLIKKKGEPLRIVGDIRSGYYCYENGIEYSYINNVVTEIAVRLYTNDELGFNIMIDGIDEEVRISQDTKIHEFIRFLNYQNISWKSFDEKSRGAFSIKTGSGVIVIFDLEQGTLLKIVLMELDV